LKARGAALALALLATTGIAQAACFTGSPPTAREIALGAPDPRRFGGAATAPDGSVWFGEEDLHRVARLDPVSGSVREVAVADAWPDELAIAGDGTVWFSDRFNSRLGRLRRDGRLSFFAAAAKETYPEGIAIAPDGAVWLALGAGNTLLRFTADGSAFTQFPGTSTPAAWPPVGTPAGIAVAADGSVWFAETSGSRIGYLDPSRVLHEYALPATDAFPERIAVDGAGGSWFTENNAMRLGHLTRDGMLTETTLDAEPFGVAVDPDGDVWITEEYANAVVCHRPDGTLITVAAPTRHAQPYGIALAPGRDAGLHRAQREQHRHHPLLSIARPSHGSEALALAGGDRDEVRVHHVDAAESGRKRVIAGTAQVDDLEAVRGDELAQGAAGEDTAVQHAVRERHPFVGVQADGVPERIAFARVVRGGERLESEQQGADVVPARHVLGRDHGHAARTQYATDLGDKRIGIGQMFDHLIRDDRVERVVGKRQALLEVRVDRVYPARRRRGTVRAVAFDGPQRRDPQPVGQRLGHASITAAEIDDVAQP